MKALIVLVVLIALVPEGAMAARWKTNKPIPVWDFTAPERQSLVRATVDDFNRNLPVGAPHLSYIAMGTLSCSDLPEHGKPGGITVCIKPAPDGQSDTDITYVGGRIYRAMVALDPDPGVMAKAVCHEFMHAVTDAPDDFTNPHPDTSCVQGNLDHLGPWDVAYAESVYPFANGHKHKLRHR